MVLTDADRDEISRIVAQFGLEADEVNESPGPGPQAVTVKILVDGDEAFGLDELAEISDALDAPAQTWGPAETTIVLEVSSRGVDTPLRAARHWRRNRGRRVELVFDSVEAAPDVIKPKSANKQKAKGLARIGDVDEAGGRVWLVFKDGKGLHAQWVDLEAIDRAVVQVEFSAAPEREVAALVADS